MELLGGKWQTLSSSLPEFAPDGTDTMKPLADLVLRDVPRRYPKMSAALKASWANPKSRKKRLAAFRKSAPAKAEAMRRKWAEPGYKARVSEAMRGPRAQRSDDTILTDLRRQGLTLEQIGRQVGLTRERVRQRLKRCGDPSLVGRAAPVHVRRRQKKIERLTRVCESCGVSFIAHSASEGQFCSRRCRWAGDHIRFCARAEKIIEARRQGMTWEQAWLTAGYNTHSGNMASSAMLVAKRYAESENVDISDIFGGQRARQDREAKSRARETGASA